MPHGVSAYQKTIQRSVSIKGIGVHSGLPACLELHPLAANMGLIIERSDLKGENQIFASIENVVDTRGATTLANKAGVSISTVEHIMAALAVNDITNVLIRIDGPETPIMDGSSEPHMRLIQEAGIRVLDAPQTRLRVLKPVEIIEENRHIRLEPSDQLSFSISQDFGGREGLQPQSCEFDIDANCFDDEISKARSFGFYEDAQKLYALGLAKGSSLDNALVFKDGAVMNPEGLRYENEMVRHKVLDAIGDFFLCGHSLKFRCTGHNIGHEFNNLIMRKLLATPDAFVIEDAIPLQPASQSSYGADHARASSSVSRNALSGLNPQTA